MFGNLDPQKVAQVQGVSKTINAEIRIHSSEHKLEILLRPTTVESATFVLKFLPNFAENIATQLNTFFGITGEIVDVSKKG